MSDNISCAPSWIHFWGFHFSPFVWFLTLQANSHLIFASHRILSYCIAWRALDDINCLGTNWIPQRMLPVCCAPASISIPLHSTIGQWKSTTFAIYSMRHVWCLAYYTVYDFIYHSYYTFRMYFIGNVRFTIYNAIKSSYSPRLFSVPMAQPIWDATCSTAFMTISEKN